MRHYLAELVGDGLTTETAFRPVIVDLLPGLAFQAADGRVDATLGSGWLIVSCEVTDAEHAFLNADPRVTAIPLEDVSGAALPLNATLNNVPLTKRQQILTRCEAQHIPMQDIGLSNTVRDALKRIIKRCLLRQRLSNLDYVEGLDTLVSAIPAQRRNAIRDRLVAQGFNTTVIVGSDTIREALRKLMLQLPDQTHLD